MKAARLLAILLVLGLGAAAYFYTHRQAELPGAVARSGGLAQTERPPIPVAATTGQEKKDETGYPVDQPSELVAQLNAPGGDVNADLRIVNAVFEAYRSGTRDEDPVGENVEITAALTGKNRLDYAFIPQTCPALNARGELCDRWGTPYFFHQLSGTDMEVRSAGPDRKLWTADDVVLTPP